MAALALVALAAALFAPLWRAGFVYDDLWFIVRNPALGRVTPVAFLLRPETAAAAGSGLGTGNFRPLAVLSLALDRAVWGLNPAFYHAENVAWHALNAVLVFWLARRWLKTSVGAWLAACVFLVHPVQVETVAWACQRSNLLCAAGLLGALLLLTGARGGAARAAGGLAAYALALYAKEQALVLPGLLVLIDLLEGRRSPRERRRLYAWVAALTAAYAASRMLIGHPWSQFDSGAPSLRTDLMLGAAAFPVYLGKLLAPVALRPSYDYPSFDAWKVAGGALMALSCAAGGLALARRGRLPGAALLWIGVSLLPVLHLVPLRPFVAERFLYVAAAGAGFLAGWAYERGGLARWCMLAWTLALCLQTRLTVPHWLSERALWASAVAAEPANAFARVCYAQALEDPAQAEAQYRAALVDQPSDTARFAALNNLSNLLLRQGRAKNAAYWAELAVREQPQEEHALYNLCRAYSASGDPRRRAACAALARRRTAPSLP